MLVLHSAGYRRPAIKKHSIGGAKAFYSEPLVFALLPDYGWSAASNADYALHGLKLSKIALLWQNDEVGGGEQQMLAIGRALMAAPRILRLDEPSLGLAPLLVRRVFDRLEAVRQQTGMSVLLVEQNFRMTVQLADDVYLLGSGTVVAHQAAIDAYLGSAGSHSIADDRPPR